MKNACRIAGAILVAFALDTAAVSLNPDGLGQALIYPYYTVNSAAGNPFHTYLSVVNHAAQAKVLRVRLREGRLGKETLSFNLFLGANDAWTGAVVPIAGGGARLITRDTSCADPAFATLIIEFQPDTLSILDLRSVSFTGANADGAGTQPERVREGFLEVIEMATLTGASAAAVTHDASGAVNCAAVRNGAALSVATPTGGLSGTLTLINVASGMDFTVNAEALSDLASRPFFRPPADPYPDFAAAEIDPVSLVVANGKAYRSVWSRPVDAVSAVMMRDRWIFEYALDTTSASLTDLVLTFPTRQLHAASASASAPFSRPAAWSSNCANGGERIASPFFNREESSAAAAGCPGPCPPDPAVCAAAAVGSVQNGAAHMTPRTDPTGVLGSITKGLGVDNLPVTAAFQNGWMRLSSLSSIPMTSLAESTRIDLATGQQTTGAHQFSGLPVLGMWLRTLKNGNLDCNSAVCQGNYGSAYSMRYRVGVSP